MLLLIRHTDRESIPFLFIDSYLQPLGECLYKLLDNLYTLPYFTLSHISTNTLCNILYMCIIVCTVNNKKQPCFGCSCVSAKNSITKVL